MTDEPSWVPPGVDTQRANVARVYDYWLGGTHNFPADQDLARAIAAVVPAAREAARDNRAFLGRAVRFLLHFIDDSEDPWRIVATLRNALAPGSYLVLGHLTDENMPKVAHAAEKVYNRGAATNVHLRSRADILRFFDSFGIGYRR